MAKQKTYLIAGVAEFAHVTEIMVTAKNKKEAKKKAEEKLQANLEQYVSLSLAEYTGCVLDKPEICEE